MTTYTLKFAEMTGTPEVIIHGYEIEAATVQEANKHIEAIEKELRAENPGKEIFYDGTTS